MFGNRTEKKRERLYKRANRLLYKIQKLQAQFDRVSEQYRRSLSVDPNEF